MKPKDFDRMWKLEDLVKETKFLVADDENHNPYNLLNNLHSSNTIDWYINTKEFSEDANDGVIYFRFALLNDVVVCFWYHTYGRNGYKVSKKEGVHDFFIRIFKNLKTPIPSYDCGNFNECIKLIKNEN